MIRRRQHKYRVVLAGRKVDVREEIAVGPDVAA